MAHHGRQSTIPEARQIPAPGASDQLASGSFESRFVWLSRVCVWRSFCRGVLWCRGTPRSRIALRVGSGSDAARVRLRRGHRRRMPRGAGSGSFGSQGAAGSCRAPGAGGSLGRYCRVGGSGAALGFVRSRAIGERAAAPRAGAGAPPGASIGPSSACSAWSALSVLQRAPELGHGRAAIAQQRLERRACRCRRGSGRARGRRSRAAAPRTARLRCDRPAPGATRRPRRGARARSAARRPAPAPRPAPPRARRTRRASSSGSTRYFCARMPCLSAFCAELRLAFFGLRPARLRAVLAARLGARIADGDGRARRGADTGHGGIPCWLARAGWTETRRPDGRLGEARSLPDPRNIVQRCGGRRRPRAGADAALTFR